MSKPLAAFAPVTDDTLADPGEVAAAYARWVRRTGLADLTKAAYSREVASFAVWLSDQTEHTAPDVFTDPFARDYAARDYKRWMLRVKKRKPKGVDLALTSLSSLFTWLGLGSADVKLAAGRQLGQPKGLDEREQRAVMRAAQRRGVRDHAIIAIFLATGARVSEVSALDVDDIWVTERRGEVQIRAGKGDKPRSIGLNSTVRPPIAAWLRERNSYPRAGAPPLWLTKTGDRLATRSVRYVVNEVGKSAGVDLHPHLLRHTAARTMVRAGTDLVAVAEIFGWASIETARNYSNPTAADVEAAVEHLNIDY